MPTEESDKLSTKAEQIDALLANIKKVQSELNSLEAQFDTFDIRFINNQGVLQQRNGLAAQVVAKRNELLQLHDAFNAIIAEIHDKFLSRSKQIQEIFNSATNDANSAKDFAAKAKTISENALKTATKASGISAGVPLIEHFIGRDTRLWLPLIGWAALVVIFFGLALYFIIHVEDYLGKPDINSGASVSLYISSKIIIISLLVGAIAWCARLYKDAYDKKSFYKHKIVITRTYQAFVQSSLSDDTKDAVLRESIKQIFSPPPSVTDVPKAEIDIMQNLPELLRGTGKA